MNQQPLPRVEEIERLRNGNAVLLRQLAEARMWFDTEHPADEGCDQVYPWDHLP